MRDKQYIILRASYSNDLVKEVNEKMLEGWVPLGGVAATPDGSGIYYVQAMVKLPLTPKPLLG